ncbi:MAG TPA: hypothetical protein VHY08_07520 [Bacillota bacterium]|nr:hypothetical protein [Bacillota bacterium]
MLDIKLIQKNEMMCEESVLATISGWFGRRHEMIYSQFWRFKLLPDEPKFHGVIGGRIHLDFGDMYQLLAQYHGVQCKSHRFFRTGKILDIARQQLKAGFPVVALFNDSLIPMIPPEEKAGFFPLIIVGLDDECRDARRQDVQCFEIHTLKKVIRIPAADFLKGYSQCTTYSLNRPAKEQIDWRDVISRNTGYLLENNAFDSLRTLAELIRTLDYQVERNDEKDVVKLPLTQRMKDIYRSRYLFSYTLDYLIQEHQAAALEEYPEYFRSLSGRWVSAWGLLTMAFRQRELNLPRNFPGQMDKLSKKILTLANMEEDLCHALQQTLKGQPARLKLFMPRASMQIRTREIQEYVYLDIEKQLNNQGFSTRIEPDPSADLTGSRQFFLTAGLPSNDLWVVEGMKFRFLPPAEDRNDNISCLGQTIFVPKDHYAALMLLGCAEWGNKSELLEISYEDGQTISLPLEFSDWIFKIPAFDEVVAWEGRCAEKTPTGVAEIPWFRGHLFAKMLPLDQNLGLERIILPDCGNIHLFAITLGK